MLRTGLGFLRYDIITIIASCIRIFKLSTRYSIFLCAHRKLESDDHLEVTVRISGVMALTFRWFLMFLVSLPFSTLAQSSQGFNKTPDSPCPTILQYVTNGKIWFGEIKFSASSYGSQILLDVKMTVDSRLDSVI